MQIPSLGSDLGARGRRRGIRLERKDGKRIGGVNEMNNSVGSRGSNLLGWGH